MNPSAYMFTRCADEGWWEVTHRESRTYLGRVQAVDGDRRRWKIEPVQAQRVSPDVLTREHTSRQTAAEGLDAISRAVKRRGPQDPAPGEVDAIVDLLHTMNRSEWEGIRALRRFLEKLNTSLPIRNEPERDPIIVQYSVLAKLLTDTYRVGFEARKTSEALEALIAGGAK